MKRFYTSTQNLPVVPAIETRPIHKRYLDVVKAFFSGLKKGWQSK